MSDSNGKGRAGTGRGGSFKSLVDRRESGPRLNSILDNSQQLLGDAIHAAIMGGLGVLVAPTSDGGAVSVTVYDGDERLRSYASSADEWKAVLGALTDAGDAAATVHLQKYSSSRTGR
jgi:hypothetical protein